MPLEIDEEQAVAAMILRLCRGRVVFLQDSDCKLAYLPKLLQAYGFEVDVLRRTARGWLRRGGPMNWQGDPTPDHNPDYTREDNSRTETIHDTAVMLICSAPFAEEALAQAMGSLSSPGCLIVVLAPGTSPSAFAEVVAAVEPERLARQTFQKIVGAWRIMASYVGRVPECDPGPLSRRGWPRSLLHRVHGRELVSVIIPTRNRAHWLAQAVESVLSQTYANVEIIVVDHGSTDDTSQVLETFGASVRVLRVANCGDQPQGAARPGNAGLAVAQGKYVCRLDDDDTLLPDALALQVRAFRELPSSVALVHGAAVLVDSARVLIGYLDRAPMDAHEMRLKLLAANQIVQSTAMLRRGVIERTGRYDEHLCYGEDYDLWLKVARHYAISYVDVPLVEYRVHDGSATATQGSARVTRAMRYLRRRVYRWNLPEWLGQGLATVDRESLSRAYASRAEGSLRWCMDAEAHRDMVRARSYLPDMLERYGELWTQYPALWTAAMDRGLGRS